MPPRALTAARQPQRAVRGAIVWSHGLLTATEQVVLRRLSVFVGGFSLAAAGAVCGPDVRDALSSLLDHGLIRHDVGSDGEPRFRMPEAIRAYALERLLASGEAMHIQWQHARWCLALALEAEPHLRGPDQDAWANKLEHEHDNLRAALRWTIEQRQADWGLRLSGALWRFWWRRSHFTEGRAWLEGTLAMATPEGLTSLLHARAQVLCGLGAMACARGAYAEGCAWLEEGLTWLDNVAAGQPGRGSQHGQSGFGSSSRAQP